MAEVIDPGNKVVLLGFLSTAEVEELERELGARFVNTGVDQSGRLIIALVVLIVGSALIGLARRRGSPT
jgi:hypothetical protein